MKLEKEKLMEVSQEIGDSVMIRLLILCVLFSSCLGVPDCPPGTEKLALESRGVLNKAQWDRKRYPYECWYCSPIPMESCVAPGSTKDVFVYCQVDGRCPPTWDEETTMMGATPPY